ncbi:hypothetical protein TRFO_04371 [Tritrichomonas foetus]|uniref:At2g35280-like TPR domain-containing protein n=1 Tax=Tritrichomonas foetus TaxID=1144522 RepID=A0A1J4KF96_9EUKA|nr:hypothetical protein TRFO_04371 [Tritrichomonas foetus]|eukprot:OHT09851.1 hypothetical protein TRFO_04371 [Tritrichomonas foetus]
MMHLQHNNTGYYINSQDFGKRCDFFRAMCLRSFGNTLKVNDRFSDVAFTAFVLFIERNEKQFNKEDTIELLSIADQWHSSLLIKEVMHTLMEKLTNEEIIKQYVDLLKRGITSSTVENHIAQNFLQFIKVKNLIELPPIDVLRLLTIYSNIYQNSQTPNISNSHPTLHSSDLVDLCTKCIFHHGRDGLILLSTFNIEEISKDYIEKLSNSVSFMPNYLIVQYIKCIASINNKHSNTTSKLGKKISIIQTDINKYAQYLNESLAGNSNDGRLAIAEMRLTGRYLDQNFQEAFKQYAILAKLNNDSAQYQLAECYGKGIGTIVNEDEGIKYYRLSADQGNKDALLKLADKLIGNSSLIKNKKDYIHYLTEASKVGHTQSQYKIGKMYEKGKDIKQNSNLAIDNFRESALNGNQKAAKRYVNLINLSSSIKTDKKTLAMFCKIASSSSTAHAQYIIGTMYLNGNCVDKNIEKAADFFQKAADSNAPYGDAAAAYGDLLKSGHGMMTNLTLAAKYYEIAVKCGSKNGAYSLAEMYEAGVVVSHDMNEAAKNYKIAAENGHAKAAYRLGVLIEDGKIPGKLDTESFYFFKIAADNGDSDAAMRVGKAYKLGIGVDKNDIEAQKYLEIAANQGNSVASFYVGQIYFSRNQLDVSMKYYQIAADAGNSDAAYALGELYESGISVPSYTEAAKYYQIAVKNGHLFAFYRLARMYELGHGVPIDDSYAFQLYQKASNRGHIDSTYRLGVFYEIGKFIDQDCVQAVKLLQVAADNGCADAMNELAHMILDGRGVTRSTKRAIRLFQTASESGSKAANFYIGKVYLNGADGLDKDEKTAVNYFYKATQNGYDQAALVLGQMYLEGIGVAKNEDTAQQYFSMAAELGNKDAMYNLAKVLEEKGDSKAFLYMKGAAEQNHADAAYKYAVYIKDGKIPLPPNTDSHQIELQYLDIAATNGNSDAAFEIGVMHYKNENYFEALKKLKIATDSGHIEANYYLGKLLLDGKGTLPDILQGTQHIITAAEAGNTPAQLHLAYAYLNGVGVEKCDDKALSYFLLSAQTSPDAMLGLGKLYEAQNKLNDALKYYIKAADNNQIEASYIIGSSYLNGSRSLPTDIQLAIKYLEYSADRNDPKSCMLLVDLSNNKDNTYHPPNEFLHRIIRIAAESKHPYSSYIIGQERENVGNCVEAMNLYQISSDGGVNEASYRLGILYEEGRPGIEKDELKAIKLFTIASERGNADAQYKLAFMNEEGRGVPQNITEAIRLYKLSADLGHPLSSYRYAIILYKMNKNREEIIKYLNISAEAKNKDAALMLGDLLEGEDKYQAYKTSASLGSVDGMYKYGLLLRKDGKEAEAIKMFYHAASGNHPNASYEYALTQEQSNPQAAGNYYRIAYEQNNGGAAYKLGLMIFEGRGFPINHTEAAQVFSRGASIGNVNCLYLLGGLYESGKGVYRNDNEAIKYYKQAVDKGSIEAAYRIGIMYEQGKGVDLNASQFISNTNSENEAPQYFKFAADNGHALSASRLAYLMETGRGIQQDEKQALYYYKIAADKGESTAAYSIAQKLEFGRSIDKNLPLAAHYYKVAADSQNLPDASYKFAQMLEEGIGIEKNEKQAVTYYYQAAKGSHMESIFKLGMILHDGKAVAKNNEQALQYFRIAGNSGNLNSLYMAATLLETGDGVPQNLEEAVKLYTEAANRRHKLSAQRLADLYRVGVGVPKNSQTSDFYQRIALLPS